MSQCERGFLTVASNTHSINSSRIVIPLIREESFQDHQKTYKRKTHFTVSNMAKSMCLVTCLGKVFNQFRKDGTKVPTMPRFHCEICCFRWLPKVVEKACRTTLPSSLIHKTFRKYMEKIYTVSLSTSRSFFLAGRASQGVKHTGQCEMLSQYVTVRQYSRNNLHLTVYRLSTT